MWISGRMRVGIAAGAIYTAMGCAALGQQMGTAADNKVKSPVLVELFTSQGCSTCPPVDAAVQKWDATQPVPGAELIVLGEHVDYFNHDGWKDPYSSHEFTDRQYSYVRALGLKGAATPDIVVDGNIDLSGKTPPQLEDAFKKAIAEAKVPVHLGTVDIDASSNAPIVRARVEVDGTSAPHNADIYEAVALDHTESQVSAGENKGHTLENVAAVVVLRKIGELDKGKTFSKDVSIKLPSGTNPNNLRIVVFVQNSGPGEVLGAAMHKTPSR